MTISGHTLLCNVNRLCLDEYKLSITQNGHLLERRTLTFQDEYYRVDRTKSVCDLMEYWDLNCLKKSLDHNAIENVWDYLV